MDFNIESRFTQKFIAEKKLPQNTQISQKFIAEKRLPQNTQNSQKFIAEKRLPQNSQIYTDVSKMFCVFREICGSLRLRGRSLLLKRKLPRNSRNTQKFIAEKKLPQISRIYTDASKLFCEFREFCGSFYVI